MALEVRFVLDSFWITHRIQVTTQLHLVDFFMVIVGKHIIYGSYG